MKVLKIQYNRKRRPNPISTLKKEFVQKLGPCNSKLRRSSAGYRIIDGKNIYFRSMWEANYARWLSFQKKNFIIFDWEYEPKTFWFEAIKRGVRSYLPDFKVHLKDGTHKYVEVKGYYDAKSLTKIKRFRKYYPEENLTLIDKEWFKENNNTCRAIIQHWEKG